MEFSDEVAADSVTSLIISRVWLAGGWTGEGGRGPNWKGEEGRVDISEPEPESGIRRLVRLLLLVAGDRGW